MSNDATTAPIMELLAANLRAVLAGSAPAPWAGPRPDAPPVCAVMAADAPISPEQLIGAPPGLLYTIRPVGGLVPPAAGQGQESSIGAALEFAVRVLGVGDLILFGHRDGAFVRALTAEASSAAGAFVRGDYLPALAAMLGPGVLRAVAAQVGEAERARICTQEIMRLSIENLMSYPWIVDRVLGGTLLLHGWYVGGADGGFERLDPASDSFVPDQAAPLTDGK